MKCPYCGNELDGKDICSKCGKKVTTPEHELEIEYKEFKVSEFLEIRKKQKKSGEAESEEPSKEDIRKQKGADEPVRRPLPNEEDVATAEREGAVKKEGKKKHLNLVILIFIVAGVIAGAFFFLNFLLK